MSNSGSKLRNCSVLLLAGVGIAACVAEVWKHWIIRRAFHEGKVPSGTGGEVSVLQPVTKGTVHLREHLASRVGDEHIVSGDLGDEASRSVADSVFATHSNYTFLASPAAKDGGPALKTAKQRAALAVATKEVVLFVDDDVILPRDAARVAASWLNDPKVGSVFGVPFSSYYSGFWSSLMSSFVNRFAFPSYLPLASVMPIYTVTGHWYAVRRTDLLEMAGRVLEESRIDDDHALARELRARGFRLIQVPLVHRVENKISSALAFHRQMKRWFVFVREMMHPHLTWRDKTISGILAFPESVFPWIFIGAILLRSRLLAGLAAGLAGSGVFHVVRASQKAGWKIPPGGLLLTPVVSLLAPLYVGGLLLFANNRIWWRGREFEAQRDGKVRL